MSHLRQGEKLFPPTPEMPQSWPSPAGILHLSFFPGRPERPHLSRLFLVCSLRSQYLQLPPSQDP